MNHKDHQSTSQLGKGRRQRLTKKMNHKTWLEKIKNTLASIPMKTVPFIKGWESSAVEPEIKGLLLQLTDANFSATVTTERVL